VILCDLPQQRSITCLGPKSLALIEPYLPAIKRLGRPRTVNLRAVVPSRHLLHNCLPGDTWHYLPKDFPPFTTVQFYFYRWRDSRLMEKISHSLCLPCAQH